MELSRAEMDATLEDMAIDLHLDTPAVQAHHMIAKQMWGHIKALEYTTGRLLVVGRDADLLAGAPPDGPRALDGLTVDSTLHLPRDITDHIPLTGELPGLFQWPHPDLNLEPIDAPTVEAADLTGTDVVIMNLPYADTRALTRDRQIDLVVTHHSLIQQALTWLRPGGLLVALAHRQLLEGTDAQPRRSIAKHADLIAAARLPAGALRRAPLLDSPVDLLMFRRREPGHLPGGLPFIDRVPVRAHGLTDMRINQCYAIGPWAVLGNIVPDPVQPGVTTAAPYDESFGTDLGDVLKDQTTIAIEVELYSQVRPPLERQADPTLPATEPPRSAPTTDGPAL